MSSDSIRRKIETLGTQISLPTVRKALGVLEGEHASGRRGGAGDVMDVRVYEPGDESRLIDWKTSARQGQPMVVQRERLSTSRVWLLMDVGREMTGVCPSGEQACEVAANALRMFAALSLRRSDDVSIVFGDEAAITRIPFNGGFAQFERTLDKALTREWNHKRNIDALLEYARRIKDRHALIVLATDELAMTEHHIQEFRRIARTHPIVLIDVATLNPFKPLAKGQSAPLDGVTNRRVPAFLRSSASAQQVETHRHYLAAALEQELNRAGSFMIRAGSSEDMFNRFVQLVSVALARTTRNQLGASPELNLGLAGDRR
ncbi:hypothetical protein BISA_1174 [Bifidobacterium saguini DSM 23967]|uniref:DUF58 domain-containing protein n=2 Tax=Bifidobacterium saguini TaxID=762210 RepID=A0A087DBW0_9BIFI|nr:DUF58 domain-containing protein [Bifidobacterium saguini]KFI93010.1 hypothetical protein BISA_1174 [Bifidobacterium saguini DSM 23967]QTB91349.1 DUF58 domain-containing protein [Bifidobacterium saguini]